MYEETNNRIDWKGLFLKVIIVFLIVLIAVKGYSILKGNNNKKVDSKTTQTIAESKSKSTFTENIEKLRNAGEKYYKTNSDKLPKEEGNTSMVTLNELIESGDITALSDENGKTCDGESSYVTAMLEGEKTKIKANLVCGKSSSYSLVYLSESDAETAQEENKTTYSSNKNSVSSSSSKTTTSNTNSSSTNNSGSTCGSSCGTPSIKVSTNTTANQSVTINGSKNTTPSKPTNNNTNNNYVPNNTTRTVRVSFDSNGGSTTYPTQKMNVNEYAYNPGTTRKSGYTFLGWYLNGYKYNFNTPVTEDITLVAKFERDYYEDDDYYESEAGNCSKTSSTTYTCTIYSLPWEEAGTQNLNISHTLRVPSYITNKNVSSVRIKSASITGPLTTQKQLNNYHNYFNDTFIYVANGWEARNINNYNLGKVNTNYASLHYNTNYKNINTAINQGFDVRWTSSRVSSDCQNKFSVKDPYSDNYATNLCGFGLVYKVVWEYRN